MSSSPHENSGTDNIPPISQNIVHNGSALALEQGGKGVEENNNNISSINDEPKEEAIAAKVQLPPSPIPSPGEGQGTAENKVETVVAGTRIDEEVSSANVDGKGLDQSKIEHQSGQGRNGNNEEAKVQDVVVVNGDAMQSGPSQSQEDQVHITEPTPTADLSSAKTTVNSEPSKPPITTDSPAPTSAKLESDTTLKSVSVEDATVKMDSEPSARAPVSSSDTSDTIAPAPLPRIPTPSSRTSTPPLTSIAAAAKKKFNAFNVNKEFLSKAASPSPAPSKPRTTAAPVPIPSVSSKLLSTKLTTVPSSKPNGSPKPTASGSSSSSPWAKPALLNDAASSNATSTPLHQPAPNKVRLPDTSAMGSAGGAGMAMSGAQGLGVPKKAWGAVGKDGWRPIEKLSREFPTAKEVAEGQRAAQMSAQMAAQAQAAHNQAILQGLNAFTHLEPGAHRWDDEDEEDDVIDFGDGTTYRLHEHAHTSAAENESSGAGKGSTAAETNSHGEVQSGGPSQQPTRGDPITKNERFADDFDRSWPRRTDSLSKDASHNQRVLFNHSSNRLEPPLSRRQGPGGASLPHDQPPPHQQQHQNVQPQRLMTRDERSSQSPHSLSIERPLPPHLQQGDRGALPHMAGARHDSFRRQPNAPLVATDGSSWRNRGASSTTDHDRELPPHLASTQSSRPSQPPNHSLLHSKLPPSQHQLNQHQQPLHSSSHVHPPTHPSLTARPPSTDPTATLTSHHPRSHSSDHGHASTHASQTVRSTIQTSAESRRQQLVSPEAPLPSIEPDEQAAEMHSAAEKARLRRMAEEAEREAAAERARQKAKELAARIGGPTEKERTPESVNASAAAPSNPTQPQVQPISTIPSKTQVIEMGPRTKTSGLGHVGGNANGAPSGKVGPHITGPPALGPPGLPVRPGQGQGQLPPPPQPTTAPATVADREVSWRARPKEGAAINSGNKAATEPTSLLSRPSRQTAESYFEGPTQHFRQGPRDAPPHASFAGSLDPPSLVAAATSGAESLRTIKDPEAVMSVNDNTISAPVPGRAPPKKETYDFDSILAKIQATMVGNREGASPSRTLPEVVQDDHEQVDHDDHDKSSVRKGVLDESTNLALSVMSEYFSVTMVEPPKSPPPAWRLYTVRLPKQAPILHPSRPSTTGLEKSKFNDQTKLSSPLASLTTSIPPPKGWAMTFNPPLEGLNALTLSRAELLIAQPIGRRFSRQIDTGPIVSISPRTLEPFHSTNNKSTPSVAGKRNISGVQSTSPVVNSTSPISAPSLDKASVPIPQVEYQKPTTATPATSIASSSAPAKVSTSSMPSSSEREPVQTQAPLPLPISAGDLEVPSRRKSPVKPPAAAIKAEKDRRFLVDSDNGVGVGISIGSGLSGNRLDGDGKDGADPGAGSGVRFIMSSELEGDSLLDEVNKMSLESVEEDPAIHRANNSEATSAISGPTRHSTPPNGSTPWTTNKSSLSYSSQSPARPGTAQHEHLKSVWEQTAADAASVSAATSVTLGNSASTSTSQGAGPSSSNLSSSVAQPETPLYPSLNGPLPTTSTTNLSGGTGGGVDGQSPSSQAAPKQLNPPTTTQMPYPQSFSSSPGTNPHSQLSSAFTSKQPPYGYMTVGSPQSLASPDSASHIHHQHNMSAHSPQHVHQTLQQSQQHHQYQHLGVMGVPYASMPRSSSVNGISVGSAAPAATQQAMWASPSFGSSMASPGYGFGVKPIGGVHGSTGIDNKSGIVFSSSGGGGTDYRAFGYLGAGGHSGSVGVSNALGAIGLQQQSFSQQPQAQLATVTGGHSQSAAQQNQQSQSSLPTYQSFSSSTQRSPFHRPSGSASGVIQPGMYGGGGGGAVGGLGSASSAMGGGAAVQNGGGNTGAGGVYVAYGNSNNNSNGSHPGRHAHGGQHGSRASLGGTGGGGGPGGGRFTHNPTLQQQQQQMGSLGVGMGIGVGDYGIHPHVYSQSQAGGGGVGMIYDSSNPVTAGGGGGGGGVSGSPISSTVGSGAYPTATSGVVGGVPAVVPGVGISAGGAGSGAGGAGGAGGAVVYAVHGGYGHGAVGQGQGQQGHIGGRGTAGRKMW